MIEIAKQNKWNVVLLSELRSESCGVLYLGQDEDLIVLIHSERAGVMLRGHLVSDWLDQGLQKYQSERCVSVRVNSVVYTATYQPVYYHDNQEEIEIAKRQLKNHVEWSKSHEIAVIGGDFNAHIGGNEDIDGVNGRFGLRDSNNQGLELLQFCQENNLSYCNSFYNTIGYLISCLLARR